MDIPNVIANDHISALKNELNSHFGDIISLKKQGEFQFKIKGNRQLKFRFMNPQKKIVQLVGSSNKADLPALIEFFRKQQKGYVLIDQGMAYVASEESGDQIIRVLLEEHTRLASKMLFGNFELTHAKSRFYQGLWFSKTNKGWAVTGSPISIVGFEEGSVFKGLDPIRIKEKQGIPVQYRTDGLTPAMELTTMDEAYHLVRLKERFDQIYQAVEEVLFKVINIHTKHKVELTEDGIFVDNVILIQIRQNKFQNEDEFYLIYSNPSHQEGQTKNQAYAFYRDHDNGLIALKAKVKSLIVNDLKKLRYLKRLG